MMASGQLASSALKNVHGLDTGEREKKGSGAYGAVYKVTVDGVPCIAKRLHDILVDPEVPKRQRASIQQKFLDECVLLSQLRHPNVVHFVGVHYGSNRDDMSLIMECLDTDLARCLETQPNIPIEVKLLILLDVSYGLLYLHTHSPQIIHRDLTAANILLTRDKRAKIADLGVSKLLDPRTQAAMMQTKAPGTHFYMPPEALKENPKYDNKLDIFSFGHLALYVINQDFPEVFEVTITPVVLHEETLQILKRRKAIDEMGRDHCLHDVVTKCLQDNPKKRPTTLKLNEMLNRLCMKHPREYQELTEDLVRSRAEVTTLTTEVEQLRREKGDLLGEVEAHMMIAHTFQEDFQQERKDREKAHSQVAEVEERYQYQLQSVVTQLNNTSQDLQKHKETLAKTETLLHSQIEQLSEKLRDKDQQLATIGVENDRLQEEVLSKMQQVKQYKKQLDQYKQEVGALKQSAEMQIRQVEKFAEESEEWQSRAAEWKSRHDTMEGEVRRERSRREAFGRKIAELETVNDQLQQERPPYPAKTESQPLSRMKASPPMQRAHSSDESSGYNSQQARMSPLQKMKVHSVDNDAILNSRGTDSYGGDGIGIFSKPPTIPPRSRAAPLGFCKPSVSASGHTPSPGIGVGGVPPMRPSIPATSYSHTSAPYSDGGHSSNAAASRPPAIHYPEPPTMAGSYYYDHQGQIPHASTQRNAPSGYNPQQPQPAQSQRGTAPPYHANLHPGYSIVKHAYEDSSVLTGHHSEKESLPSSNISSQSSQPPEPSQQMPLYSGRSSRPPHQQPSYGGVVRGGNNQPGPLPSRFSPPGGFTNAPQPAQQPYQPPRSGNAYPMPNSTQGGPYPTPCSQLGHHGTNTSPNELVTRQSGPTPCVHSANVHHPLQETQQGPSGQPQPPSRAAYNIPNTSQPSRGMESNQLDIGIEQEIYLVAKDIMSDSEPPQTLEDVELPYDPNLICPKCGLKFRIGEIQKYRRHVKTCGK